MSCRRQNSVNTVWRSRGPGTHLERHVLLFLFFVRRPRERVSSSELVPRDLFSVCGVLSHPQKDQKKKVYARVRMCICTCVYVRTCVRSVLFLCLLSQCSILVSHSYLRLPRPRSGRGPS